MAMWRAIGLFGAACLFVHSSWASVPNYPTPATSDAGFTEGACGFERCSQLAYEALQRREQELSETFEKARKYEALACEYDPRECPGFDKTHRGPATASSDAGTK